MFAWLFCWHRYSHLISIIGKTINAASHTFAPKFCWLKHLKALNKYFWKYRVRFFMGMIFVMASNYFAVLAPQVTGILLTRCSNDYPMQSRYPKSPGTIFWFNGLLHITGATAKRFFIAGGHLQHYHFIAGNFARYSYVFYAANHYCNEPPY